MAGGDGNPAKPLGISPTARLFSSLGLLLAVLLWYWPTGAQFRSDDYVALSYVQDFGNVLADFVGPQYGVQRVALFHRPLITLSIYLDALIGGNQPFFSLLMNALVHGLNALLLLALARRFLPSWSALAAVAFWAFHPLHSEAVGWMVGRVDTHSAFFILLTILLEQRSLERGERVRAGSLLACLLAFWTKESSFVLPGLLFLLALAHGRSLRQGLARSLPYGALLVAALCWRLVFLGEAIGGYAEGRLSPAFLAKLPGLLLPLGSDPWTWFPLGAGLALLLFWLARRRPPSLFRSLGLLLLSSFLLALPAAGASGKARGPATDRYAYLSFVPLAAISGWGTALSPALLLAAQAPRAVMRRLELSKVNARVRAVRDQVREALATDAQEDPLLLPAPLHFLGRPLFAVGFDRLGHPPFYPGARALLPARSLFGGSGTPIPGPAPGARAAYAGPPRLDRRALADLHEGRAQARIRWTGPPVARLRLFFLTPGGHFAVELPAPKQEVSLEAALLAPVLELPRLRALQVLWPPLDLALDPRPYVWVEGLSAEGRSLGRATDTLRLPFGKDLGRIVVPLREDAFVPLLAALFLLGIRLYLRRGLGHPTG